MKERLFTMTDTFESNEKYLEKIFELMKLSNRDLEDKKLFKVKV
jgi:hypothetical protein